MFVANYIFSSSAVIVYLYVTFPSSNFVRIIGEVALTGQHCWISANELCPTAMHKVS
jgi:hypothetical protein